MTKRKTHISALACALLLLASASRAQEYLAPSAPSFGNHTAPTLNSSTIALSLTDAIFLGLRDNWSIRSAYIQRIADKFDLRVAEDAFTPKLQLNSSITKGSDQNGGYRSGQLAPTATLQSPIGTQFSLGWTHSLTRSDQNGTSANTETTLNVIQPLLRNAWFDVNMAPVRIARLGEAANKLSLQSTVSHTITQIIQAYQDLLKAQEQQRIAEDALSRSQKLLVVNQALIQAGRMAAIDIVQTEADISTQEFNVEDTKNTLRQTRQALLHLLALDLQTPIRASDAPTAEPVYLDNDKAVSIARAHQPDYLIQEIAKRQAELRLMVAQNQRLWDLSLVGGLTQTPAQQDASAAIAANRPRTWSVGLQLNIPIGDLHPQQNEVHAQVDLQNQTLRLEEAKQKLSQDVSDALNNIETLWRQYQISQRTFALSQKKLDNERVKLQLGRSSNFQVLSYEADLRNAETALLSAKINYRDAQAQLDEQLGMTLENWNIALND